MCLEPFTDVKKLRFTYVYHPQDRAAPPAIIFHDGEKCPVYAVKEEEDGSSNI
jgi:hypothetical protein